MRNIDRRHGTKEVTDAFIGRNDLDAAYLSDIIEAFTRSRHGF